MNRSRTRSRFLVCLVLAVVAALTLTACSDGPTRPRAKSAASGDKSESADAGSPNSSEDAERQKILRDSTAYEHLSTPDIIEPGAKYVVDGAEGVGTCSVGWIVRSKKDPAVTYILTAGHCGKKGETVYIDPKDSGDLKNAIPIGKFVWSDFEEQELVAGPDYALIQLDPKVATEEYMTGTPRVSVNRGQPIELVGGQDVAWLTKTKPFMCRLGWRSGITCGTYLEMIGELTVVFKGITDKGDSGGVIFAFDPSDPAGSKVFAVAVTSWVNFAEAADETNGKVIDPVMEKWGLSLIG